MMLIKEIEQLEMANGKITKQIQVLLRERDALRRMNAERDAIIDSMLRKRVKYRILL